jgi:hypothetical protein
MAKQKPTELEPTLKNPQILRAFKPGDVVFLEADHPMTLAAMEDISRQFKNFLPDLRLVVLQEGVRVAAREQATSEENLDAYRELARTVREFLEYLRISHETNQTDSRIELGHVLQMQKALEDLKP